MIKQYTPEDYKNMVDEYCKINKTAKQALNKSVVWESDIFNMSRDELVDFVIYHICKNPKSIKYLLNQKNKLNLFLDWCVGQGHISHNVLRAEGFEDEVFIFKCIDAMDITVFYDDTVEILIDKLELNKELYELLIRGFYEGIRTVKDFLLLTDNDIDYDNKTIFVSGRKRTMSDKFFDVLRRYECCFTYEFYTIGENYALLKDKKKTVQYMKKYNNHIIKVIDTSNYKDADTYVIRMISRIATYFDKISDIAGKSVSYDMLYVSGFINYVRAICDKQNKTDEYYVTLFYIGLEIRGLSKVKDYAVEYGLAKSNVTVSEIKRICFPYIVKSKYYH